MVEIIAIVVIATSSGVSLVTFGKAALATVHLHKQTIK